MKVRQPPAKELTSQCGLGIDGIWLSSEVRPAKKQPGAVEIFSKVE